MHLLVEEDAFLVRFVPEHGFGGIFDILPAFGNKIGQIPKGDLPMRLSMLPLLFFAFGPFLNRISSIFDRYRDIWSISPLQNPLSLHKKVDIIRSKSCFNSLWTLVRRVSMVVMLSS